MKQQPLQRCTVCGTENDILRLTCHSCGAVLRDRVTGLNLFETALELFAEPGDTFLRIARSEHRNYTFSLFGAAGVLIAGILLSAAAASDKGFHIGTLIMTMFLAGPVAGIILFSMNAVIGTLLAPVRLTTRRMKLHFGICAWSLMPVALFAPVVMTIAVAVFGAYLFSDSYPAWEYKPMIFWVLAGLQALSVVWSAGLLWIAFRTVGESAGKAIVQTLLFYGLTVGEILVCIALFL